MDFQPIIKTKKNLSSEVKDSLIAYVKQMDIHKNPDVYKRQLINFPFPHNYGNFHNLADVMLAVRSVRPIDFTE